MIDVAIANILNLRNKYHFPICLKFRQMKFQPNDSTLKYQIAQFWKSFKMSMQTVIPQSRLVLGIDQSNNPVSGRFNLHMLSPILLGLAAPMLVIGVVDPSIIQHGRVIIFALLAPMLMVATVLFAASLLWPGDVTAIIVDSKARKVEFVQSGVLATSSVEVHFDQIAALGLASRFDDDGYPFSQPEIQLRDGQRMALPAGSTKESIEAARRVLGL